MLERDILVEGGEIKGRMEVKVREWNKKEGDVYVGGGKVRVVGFEGKFYAFPSSVVAIECSS